MNEAAKKSASQVAILVGLFLVLGFLMFRMLSAGKQMNHRGGSRRTAAATAQKKQDPGATPSATNMPPVPRSGEPTGKDLEISEEDLHLNPNQFKVFKLSPPKNPFVQQEQWYGEKLKQLPGYPQLKDNGYFDNPQAFLPDMELLKEHDWETITVDKSVRAESYDITGTSEDGSIETHISLTPKAPEPDHLVWSRATGIPMKVLNSPAWKKQYGDRLTKAMPVKKSDNLLDEALGVPGESSGDRAPSDLLDGDKGAGDGDALYAVGVSVHGKQATALIRHNGKTRLVREGSVIPTHYQVLSIKENGILVIDLSDGSSNWLPLGAAPREDKTKKAGKAKDA
jgi:hypothetical protein